MFKTLQKSILITSLLILSCNQIVHAQKKLYQSDGKLPFVEMMLTMMSAMGMVDKVPGNGAYGGYGASGLSNPYARALAMRGMSPGSLNSGFGNNPFLRSPWLQTPWSLSALNNQNPNTASPIWGTPSWGVLPLDSYAPNNYSMYNPYYPYGSSSPWSTSDLDGWVNETWETSLWNPKAGVKAEAPVQATPPPSQQEQPNVPLEQNFNYLVPPDTPRSGQQYPRQQQAGRPSPLSKLAPPNGRPRQRTQQPSRAPAAEQRKQPPLPTDNRQNIRQKPCVTEFCGLKKPNLYGLWVAENGEMLGIKNTRYLWSDNNSRSLSGQIQVQNEYLLMSVDGYEKILRFKYKLAGNFLLTLKPDGTIREFVRVPINQYNRQ